MTQAIDTVTTRTARRERLRAATTQLRTATSSRDVVVAVLGDNGIDRTVGTGPMHGEDRWSDPSDMVDTYLQHLTGLHAGDTARTITAANIDPASQAAAEVIELYELEGNLAGIVTETVERVRSAASVYRVTRDRRELNHPDALANAVAHQPIHWWRSVPPVYLPARDRVRFAQTGRRWWTVAAVSTNYVALVQQVPFQPSGEMQYTVIDWARGVRGPANLIGGGYGDGTYSPDQCAQMLSEFEFNPATDPARLAALARGETSWEQTHDSLEVSYRNNVPIRIVDRQSAAALRRSAGLASS